ncbi:LacI family DNA-binding transcriptional regulator [Agrobacterium rhizogenes]|uniref:LacI family DNA-binding transcriptional regulator n=1 Tax=Rhizobium rhizogenes TaxID=359 RepID=UPI0022B744E3|nr:LacI family DNA-binding transcriptional regulator [Rhizobium rhizogenes]MCZ7450873.1 LacI family DNA-binding transcriptional regulator [Rhizobium rhizogenes]
MSEERAQVANMAAVARIAGVSRATVSNVLNHPDRVKPETRIAVTIAMEELKFVRNSVAARLAAGRADSIGIVVSGFDHSYSSEVITSAQEIALREGLHMVITCSNHDKALQDKHLRYFHGAGVGAVILVPMPHSDDSIKKAIARDTRLVLIDYDGVALGCPSVRIDNLETGRLAARHLLAAGKKRLHFVGPDGVRAVVEDRYSGAVEAAGPISVMRSNVNGLSRQAAAAHAKDIARLAQMGRVDGVIAATDVIGAEMLLAFLEAGLRVPTDISVIGCDHNAFAANGRITLSTVDLLSQRVGETAMELALAEIDHRRLSQKNIVLTPKVIVRGT